jgi:mannan endo-1,4-beta-mannosidase
MFFRNKRVILLLMLFINLSLSAKGRQDYVRVQNNHFVLDSQQCYFVGVNFWYGAILGSTGDGGNRARLIKELDFLKLNGVSNLRILIGADGSNGVPSKVEPALQIKPGIYNDTILDGLDFLMSELGKRKMKAVLFFTNSWEWSGGYSQYLNWAGRGKNPIPSVDGWPAYMDYVKQYAGCDECMKMLKNHIKRILTRTNRYTKKKYTDDPAVFSWQIGNEPRAFSEANKHLFLAWLKEISAYIKSLDKNHMVSVGSEGLHGCEEDMKLFEQIHADKNIDYLTMHIWPKNWGWMDIKDMVGSLQNCIDKTLEYMTDHMEVARRLSKPLVLEEFGFPRDHHAYNLKDSTSLRDKYYSAVLDRVLKSSREKDVLAGCNFWAWAGFGRPQGNHVFWQKGDDYLGDPAQEEQGLNAVFDTDATVEILKVYADRIQGKQMQVDEKATPRTQALYINLREQLGKGIMVGHQDDVAYGHDWYGKVGGSDIKYVTGQYPAVVGWELGHLENDAPYNLDSIFFADMKRLMLEVYKRGGINTISWHGDNIATGKSAWDCGQDTVVKSILPGGVNHAKYLRWLDRLAVFFSSLKDINGEAVPVIFRMYHENTGNWFWWGTKQCSPDEYNRLYRMTVTYLRDIKEVHNILYAFSTAGITTEAEFLNRYPGDEWVDLIGFDNYCGSDSISIEKYKKEVVAGLQVVTDYARLKDKIPVFAETGMESIPVSNFFSNILLPTIESFNISYLLFWRNAFNKKSHFYTPYSGHASAEDFCRFTRSKKIILSNNSADIYALQKK